MNMAKWRGERRSLSPTGFWSDQEWNAHLGCGSFRHTLRSLSPLALSDLDFWDSRSRFNTPTSAGWSCLGLSGLNPRSKISTGQNQPSGITRWSSASRLAPEGAPRPHFSSEDCELRASPEESSRRRAELIQRLRETRKHLDAQTDLLKTKGSQLQQSNLLEIKQKLSEAVEEDKEVLESSRIEENHRRSELQDKDKTLELELDILKMRSNLDRRSPLTSNQLNRSSPATKDQTLREGQKQVEKEIKKLKGALRNAEEKIEDLEYEKDNTLRQLQSSEERKQEAINQSAELEQRLNSSIKAQADLEVQLNESRSRLEQTELEKDLISTKMKRLEDNLNDLKVKLSGALIDRDRLFQEKAELLQRIQTLDLQVQKEQTSKQGFNEQLCELHSELSQAKSQANKQKTDTIIMKEKMVSVKELNEKLSSDLTKATERLKVTLDQLHELEAEKLIQTNQIAALETERLQLIGEKEGIRKTLYGGLHEKITELGERCCQQRKHQDNLDQENQTLQLKCHDLEHKVHTLEAEIKCKEEEQQRLRVEFEREREELRKVAAHWNERWLDVVMTLSSTQAELDGHRSQEKESEKVSPKDMDGEMVEVRDMLKIRDFELEEHLQELQSARDQVSKQNSEVQRLNQLLAERDQEIKEKDEDLKNLEIQRITEKAAAQIKISALEQEIFERKEQLSREEVVGEWSSEESLEALQEESRRQAERFEQSFQKLCDLESPQQAKAEKERHPETKKQKPAGSDLVDPNEQRRLVTQQLKNLFREREQRGESSPVFPRKPGSVESATNIKNRNAVDTSHQGRETHKPVREFQQGAAKGSSAQISVSQGGTKRSKGGEEQNRPITLKPK